MKKTLLLLPLLLSTVACAQGSDQNVSGAKASATATASNGSTSARATASSGSGKREVSINNDTYEFEFSYPSVVTRYEPLRTHFEAKLKKEQDEIAASGAEGKAEMEKAGYEYHKYDTSMAWDTVADLPNWLSLSGEIWSYSGGAHGNTFFDEILYDKRAKKVRSSIDLFQSSAALNAAIATRACAALDKEREKRRGEPVDKSDDVFGVCPGLDEMTLLLGSSNGKTFNRMTLLAAPYVAGPYVEGAYTVNLDIDAAVLKTVKPEYAKDFTAAR